MKIKNTSVKIMGFAGAIILPGEVEEFEDSAINAPIRRMEEMGLLELIPDEKKEVEVAEEEEDEQPKARRTAKRKN